MSDIGQRIAIIGIGAAGTSLAIRAARELRDTEIVLIERSGDFGPGIAYGAPDPRFLVNTNAWKMGGFREDPKDFARWLDSHAALWRGLHPGLAGARFTEGDYVPRMVYGAYLRWRIDEAEKEAAMRGNRIVRIPEAAVRIDPQPRAARPLRVTFAAHAPVTADAVVLATGNSQSKRLKPGIPNLFENPYDPSFRTARWTDSDHLLIFGTGLSMVDAVHFLVAQGYQGRITAISRTALISCRHSETAKPGTPLFDAETRPDRPSEIVRAVRRAFREAEAAGRPWQEVMLSIRPVTEGIWQSLPERDRRRILRVLPFWHTVRHRLPNSVADELDALIGAGRLTLVKGMIADVAAAEGGVVAHLADGRAIAGSAAVNCLGFQYRAEPLQALCPDIALRRHWSGGIDTVEPSGYRLSAEWPLYGIGPVLHGPWFETGSLSDLRLQAQQLVPILSPMTEAA